MKSKMKLAFALIAVALMVMVAVVPMIGVFTSDSDADQATVIDPKSDTTAITVTVVLYNEAGTATGTGTGFVKLAYGGYELLKSITNATTGAVFTLHEKTISSVTITYVDAELQKVDDYSAVTINNLVDGKSYTADLKKGLASQNIKFEFKNVTTTVASLLGKTGTMAAKYSVYATPAETDTTVISTGDLKFSDDFETATFWFPAKNASGTSYTTVQIVISNFSCSIGVTIAAEKKQVNINATTTVALKVNEDLVYVAPNASTANSEITVTELKQTTTGSAVESENTTIAFTMITNVIKSDGTTPTYAYFFGKIATGTGAVNKYSLALSADGSSSDASDISLSSTNKVEYTIKDAFYGNVAMGTIAVTQSGTLTADIMSGTTAEATKVGSASVNVDKSGNFFKFITLTGTGSTISNIKFGTFVPTTNDSYSGSSALTFTIPNAGFSEVSGSLLLAEGKGIAEKALTVAGSTVFGSTETGAAGAFKFAAETNKTITFTTSGAQLSGDVSVVVGAGSSGASSKTLALYISTQTVTIKAQDALGNPISGETVKLYTKAIGGTEVPTVAGFTYSAVKKAYSAEIRADVTATEYFVDISGNDYTFTRAAYVAGQEYLADEATYTFKFYQTNGTVYATAASAADVYLSNVYKTTQGTYVFEPIDPTAAGKATVTYDGTTTSATYGTYTMAKAKATNFASESSIGQKVTQAYVVYPQSGLTNNIILKGAYILDPDDEGACVIAASYDSLTATLTRSDKETPISGAKVTLLSGANAEIDVTVTDADGSFTVYTDVPFSTTQKLSFAKDGYVTGTDIVDTAPVDANNVKVKSVAATNDLYTFSIVDADGSNVKLTAEYKLTFKSDIVVPATKIAQKTMKLAVGERVVPTYVDNSATPMTVRTFDAYYVTAEDIASGEITLVSNESTYAVLVTDSEGNAINGGTNFNLKATKYIDGVKTGDVDNSKIIGKFTKKANTIGVYTTVLSELNSGEEYEVVAYGATATTNAVATNPYFESADAYVIDCTESWAFEDNIAVVESMYTAITFSLEDAAGNAIAVPTTAVGLQVSSLTHAQVTVYQQPAFGTMYFIGVDGDKYHVYAERTISGYKFPTTCYVKDGVLASPEEKVIFTFTDNVGVPLVNIEPVVSYYTTNAGQVLIQDVATNDAGAISVIFEAKDTYTYGAVLEGYAFDFQDGFVFVDQYTYVTPSFVSANGYDVSGQLINNAKVTAYDEFGAVNGTVSTITVAGGKATIPAMRVNLETVAYFKLTDNANCAYTFEDSLLPIFIANESYITGSVPYSGKAGTVQGVTLELYLEDNLVKEIKDNAVAKIVNNYYYEAILDLSEYIGETAGIAFDSILVVYYENGIEVGYVDVDPYTSVNNIVPPTYEVYTVELLPPSILVASHVGMERVGDTVTVTADGNFMIADDEGVYTDGQYTYTFAGWYVNNQKVSASPVYTFELADDVVISPQYTVTYEKTSDANDKNIPVPPEPVQPDNSIDTNVLIIGICAVIVALIAVVYAVIKKE